MNIDSIMSWVIPSGIIIFILMVLYGKLKEPIDKSIDTIKAAFKQKKQEIVDEPTHETSILTYK